MTPREYRLRHYENHPSQKVRRAKTRIKKQDV
jgi:hypothetical protein